MSALALAIALPSASLRIAWSQQDQQSQQSQRTAIKPDAPGLARNHRLILKDGTYQMVRKYEVAGDRVRYISLEREANGRSCPTPWWTGTRHINGSKTTWARTRAGSGFAGNERG